MGKKITSYYNGIVCITQTCEYYYLGNYQDFT